MRFLRTMLILALLPAAAAADVEFGGSQGAFPVFGPSAEREAYFAAREEARQAELEAQRLERERERERQADLERLEVQRQIAEARSREAEDHHDTLLLNCVVVRHRGAETTGRSIPLPPAHRQTRVTRTMPPLDPGPDRPGPYPRPPGTSYKSVPCLPFYAVRPYGTELSVSVDRGDVSGSLTIRRPGLGLGFGF